MNLENETRKWPREKKLYTANRYEFSKMVINLYNQCYFDVFHKVSSSSEKKKLVQTISPNEAIFGTFWAQKTLQ